MQTADAQGFPNSASNPAIIFHKVPSSNNKPQPQTPPKTYKYQSSSPKRKAQVDENYLIESQGIERSYSETKPSPPASVAGSIARSIAKSLRAIHRGDDHHSGSSQTAKSNDSEDLNMVAFKQQNLPQWHRKKKNTQQEHSEKQRSKKIFWACFCSQLIVILVLIILWSTSPASLVEKSVARAEGSASGAAQVLIGINDTFQINTWDEYLGLSDDDYFGDGTLCPDGVDTPITVLSDKPCYARPDATEGAYSEPIAVIFENCAPQADDWIGIYDASHNIFQPGIHRVDYWSWACGDQECQKPVRGGIIVFAGVQQIGDFKVHLHRREGEAEEMYLASSETFTVQQTCE